MVRTRSGLARSASSLMVSIETGCAASTIAAKALSMASPGQRFTRHEVQARMLIE